MHIEELLREIAKNKSSDDEGRGMENIPTCRNCSRSTVLIEHEFSPQIHMGFWTDSQPEIEETYYTCEWCDAVIDPGDVSPKAPRKPVSAGWEPEDEWARRIA